MDDIKTYRLELAEPIDKKQTEFLTLWEPKNNWIYRFGQNEIVYYVNGRYFRGQGGTKARSHQPGEHLVPIGIAQAEYNRAGEQVGGSRFRADLQPVRRGEMHDNYPQRFEVRTARVVDEFMDVMERRDTPFLRHLTRLENYPSLDDYATEQEDQNGR